MRLNRREFAKAAVAATGVGFLAPARAACVDPMPAKWDETFDVIVVGSGFAGLAAAIEARAAGAKTVVLEKMPTIGGTLLSMAEFSRHPVLPVN